MMDKYKISAAAADLGINPKEIISIIKEHTGVEKKSGAILTDGEINILFDALTQKHSVKNFKEYFATGNEAREEEAKARQADKDRKLAAQMAILEQLKAAQEAEMAAKKAAEKMTRLWSTACWQRPT